MLNAARKTLCGIFFPLKLKEMNRLNVRISIMALTAVFITEVNAVNAQTAPVSFENWCGTAQRMNDMLANPEQFQVLQQDELIRQQEASHPANLPKGTIYYIPVVFHILHNGGVENVSEEQIMNALDVINRDFRKQNADTAEVVPLFQPIIGDAEVEFLLATNAPNGECFRGYTRTQSPLTFEGDDGGAQVNAVRNGNDVFQGNWPSNQYLNVYVIADAGGAGGYTNYPSNWGGTDMSNGIWILHTQFGEIGTSGLSAGRSLTHEIGHWLNLPHTWGNSNSPGLASNCSTDDGVADTPLTIGVPGGCPVNQNDCGPVANVQNYMDYALSCQSMFTNGQVDRMRTALTSSVGGRNNLWTVGNLAATGAGELTLCQADFSANYTTICAGDNVQFSDESYNASTGWNWTFVGGVPASSTDQNPVVSYASPGVYEVILEVTDGVSSDIETRSSYITVLNAPSNLPFYDGFENYTSLNGLNEWIVENPGSNAKWDITNSAAHLGVKSAKLANFGQPSGNIDELFAASVDLSGAVASNTTLSFRYAYRKRSSGNYEKLSVHFSSDCGANWLQKKTLAGGVLGLTTESTNWTPTAADWVTVHITTFTNDFMTSSFRYKFKFESDGGNNVYLDDINIYEGDPSDEIVVGMNELEALKELTLFPNPATSEVNLSFNVEANQEMNVTITDVSGKIVQTNAIQAKTGKNLVMMDLSVQSNGMYFVTVSTNTGRKVLQFVKQ